MVFVFGRHVSRERTLCDWTGAGRRVTPGSRALGHLGDSSEIYGCGYNSRFSEVRSGWVGGDLGPVWGPFGPQAGLKLTLNDPDRASDSFKLQPHEL